MERTYQILTDAVCDLSAEWLEAHPFVTVVDTPIIAIRKGYPEVTFNNLTPDGFAEVDAYVQKGYTAKTSLPIVYETEDEAEFGITSVERLTRELVEQGKDVLYLAMNSAISGTYQQVWMLYDELTDEIEEQQMICVDTECAGTGLGRLIMDLAEAEDVQDVAAAAEYVAEHRKEIAHVFTWFDFKYIVRSGKVSALPAFFGKMLDLHPLCSAEYVGEGRPLSTISSTIKGTYRFVDVLARFVRATIADGRQLVSVAHGNCLDKAELVATAIKEYLPEAKVVCGANWRCSAAIQAHGGPTSIHVNYHRKPGSFEDSMRIFSEL